MDTDRVFWQGSHPWGTQTLLGGPDLIERSGCYITALTHAIRAIKKLDITPAEVNKKAQTLGHYQADRIEIEPACGSWGLHCPTLYEGPAGDVQVLGHLREALLKKQLAFVHFDLDDDGKGDHWCLATRLDQKRPAVILADSALARHIAIGAFKGETWDVWNGEAKHYRVLACRPVHGSDAQT